jgi:carbon monoxide dehydrogenase subunit G
MRIVGDAPMARLGQRLVNGTARKMMEEFFANFARAL